MNETTKVGIVKAKSKYGVMFEEEDGVWYNGTDELVEEWNEKPLDPSIWGAKIEITLSAEGTRKFSEIKVLEAGTGQSQPIQAPTQSSPKTQPNQGLSYDEDRQLKIVRQNCLRHATEVFKLRADSSPDLASLSGNDMLLSICGLADCFLEYVYHGNPGQKKDEKK